MNTNFYNLKGYVRVSGMLAYLAPLRTSLAALIFTTLTIVNCSGGGIFGKSSFSASTAPIGVPVGLVYQPSATNLELSNEGLGLVNTGTSPIVSVASCISGYSLTNFTITSGVVNLYNGDRGCFVVLHSFVFQTFTYNDTNTGAVAFSANPATNAVATFAKTGGTAGDLIKVFIGAQVTSPVTTAAIVFNFTDISAGATNNVGQSSVSTAVPLTVSGRTAPNYYNAPISATPTFETNGGIVFTRYLSTNTDGSGNMSFTVACGTSVTGSSADATSSCPQPAAYSGGTSRDTTQTTDVQSTEIKYIQVPDAYLACTTTPVTLTVANANSIFASPPTTLTVKSIPATASATSGAGADGQINAGIADNYGNVVTNGGFDTPSIKTGSAPIYTVGTGTYANGFQGLNNLFIMQRLDASANTLSYLYQCVDLAAITQD